MPALFPGMEKRALTASTKTFANIVCSVSSGSQTTATLLTADVNYISQGAGVSNGAVRLPPAVDIGKEVLAFGSFRNVHGSPGDDIGGGADNSTTVAQFSVGANAQMVFFRCTNIGVWSGGAVPRYYNGVDFYVNCKASMAGELTVGGPFYPDGNMKFRAATSAGNTITFPTDTIEAFIFGTGGVTGVLSDRYLAFRTKAGSEALVATVPVIAEGAITSRGTLTSFPTEPPIVRGSHPTSISGPIVSGFNSLGGRNNISSAAAAKRLSLQRFGGF